MKNLNYKITDKDKTGLIKEKSDAPIGDAHELYARAILMRLGFECGKVDLSSGPYDIYVTAYNNFHLDKANTTILKVQIKTIGSSNSLPLKGGSRAGTDREYKSSVKTYKYDASLTDMIIGIDTTSLDLYLLPSICFDKYNSSVSKTKIQVAKNNWDILLNWNDDWLQKNIKELTL